MRVGPKPTLSVAAETVYSMHWTFLFIQNQWLLPYTRKRFRGTYAFWIPTHKYLYVCTKQYEQTAFRSLEFWGFYELRVRHTTEMKIRLQNRHGINIKSLKFCRKFFALQRNEHYFQNNKHTMRKVVHFVYQTYFCVFRFVFIQEHRTVCGINLFLRYSYIICHWRQEHWFH